MSQPLQVQQVNFIDLKKLIKQQQFIHCNSPKDGLVFNL